VVTVPRATTGHRMLPKNSTAPGNPSTMTLQQLRKMFFSNPKDR
jgi:hypothetical protein